MLIRRYGGVSLMRFPYRTLACRDWNTRLEVSRVWRAPTNFCARLAACTQGTACPGP